MMNSPLFRFIYNSKMLPPEIWEKILHHAFIGQEGPDTDTLDNCRQVCRDWNKMIWRNVWKKPTKEWGIITKSMIDKHWSLVHLDDDDSMVPGSLPSDKMISHAKRLEMEGNLASGVLESLADRVKDKIIANNNNISLPEITCAASLAQHRLFGQLWGIKLQNVDLTSVPTEHLAWPPWPSV